MHPELDHKFDDTRYYGPAPFHTRHVYRTEHFYNKAAEPKEDSVVTAHHVHAEETPYEYSSGDHTMDPHYQEPVSRKETAALPVWTETHETHHHEPPRTYDSYYGPYGPTYHISHPELDHKYDDAHDVTPVAYHDHRVLPVVPHFDKLSYESYYAMGIPQYNDAGEPKEDSIETKDDSIVTAHHVHSEETPYEYSSGDHTMNPHYQEPISRKETAALPVWTETHETHHHEPPRTYDSYYGPYGPTYHISHPELDHKYDDAHDVTPVPYHDHRVLPAVPHFDKLSYESYYKMGIPYYNDIEEPK